MQTRVRICVAAIANGAVLAKRVVRCGLSTDVASSVTKRQDDAVSSAEPAGAVRGTGPYPVLAAGCEAAAREKAERLRWRGCIPIGLRTAGRDSATDARRDPRGACREAPPRARRAGSLQAGAGDRAVGSAHQRESHYGPFQDALRGAYCECSSQ